MFLKQAIMSWNNSLSREKNPLKRVALKVAIHVSMIEELDRVVRLQVLEGVLGVTYGKFTAGKQNSVRHLSKLEADLLGEGYTHMDKAWFKKESSGIAKYMENQAKGVLKWEDEAIQNDVLMYLITGSTSNKPLTIWDEDEWRYREIDIELERQPAAYRIGITNREQILSGKQGLGDITRILGNRVRKQAQTVWEKESKQERKLLRLDKTREGEDDYDVERMIHKHKYISPSSKTPFTGQGDFAWGLMGDPKSKIGRELESAITDAFFNNPNFYKNGEMRTFALAGLLWWQKIRKFGTGFHKKRNQTSIVKMVQQELQEKYDIKAYSAHLTRNNEEALKQIDSILKGKKIKAPHADQSGWIWSSLIEAFRFALEKKPQLLEKLEEAWLFYSGPGLGRKLASSNMNRFMKKAQLMIKSASIRWDDKYTRINGKKIKPHQAQILLNNQVVNNIIAAKVGSRNGWVLQKTPHGHPLFKFGHVEIYKNS